jgi:hypothetical protein
MRRGRVEHLAYLLRLWRVGRGNEAVWRASLQDVHGGERLGFASLDEACAFLRQQLEGFSEGGRPPHDGSWEEEGV